MRSPGHRSLLCIAEMKARDDARPQPRRNRPSSPRQTPSSWIRPRMSLDEVLARSEEIVREHLRLRSRRSLH